MSTRKKKKPAKRVGYVEFCIRYAVDLDDKEMVQEAKDCLFDDLTNAVKYGEESAHIRVNQCKKPPKPPTEFDIPDFLLEGAEERQRRAEDEAEELRRDEKRGAYPGRIDDSN